MASPNAGSKSLPTGSRHSIIRVHDPPKQCLKIFDKHGILYYQDGEKTYVVEIPRDKIDIIRREFYECIIGKK